METEPQIIRRLKNKSAVPETGWVFDETRTNHTLTSPTFDGLVGVVMDHRFSNNLPVGTIESTVIEIEQQLCAKLHPSLCRTKVLTPTKEKPTARAVSWADVGNFLSVALKWISLGLKPVEKDEAERRARICAGCEFNVASQGCAGCRARDFAANMAAATKGLSTSLDDKLKACAVCGCANNAQVHYPLEALSKGVTPDMVFPAWCWKKEKAAPTN